MSITIEDNQVDELARLIEHLRQASRSENDEAHRGADLAAQYAVGMLSEETWPPDFVWAHLEEMIGEWE